MIPPRLPARSSSRELPYSFAVEIEGWTEGKGGSVVYVERKGHRPIVIVKGGQKLKRVVELARKEVESAFGCRVHLFLFVKLREKRRDDSVFYRLHGLSLPPEPRSR